LYLAAINNCNNQSMGLVIHVFFRVSIMQSRHASGGEKIEIVPTSTARWHR